MIDGCGRGWSKYKTNDYNYRNAVKSFFSTAALYPPVAFLSYSIVRFFRLLCQSALHCPSEDIHLDKNESGCRSDEWPVQ